MRFIVTILLAILIAVVLALAEDYSSRIKGEIITIYSPTGNVIGQSQNNKGWHRVSGTVNLVNGEATINLNSDPVDGRQDVSFKDNFSYGGYCWTTNLNTRFQSYAIYPVSGTKFKVVSSDMSDHQPIHYLVEGQ